MHNIHSYRFVVSRHFAKKNSKSPMLRGSVCQLARKLGSVTPAILHGASPASRLVASDVVAFESVSSGIFSESFQDTLSPSSYSIPVEVKPVVKQRRKINKLIWQHMKQHNSDQLEIELEKLRSNVVPLDEVTYVHMFFGYLLLPKQGIPSAESVLDRMHAEPFIHPTLKEFLVSFLDSLKTLNQCDAFPNRTAILKSTIPFLEIAAKVKEKRLKSERGYTRKHAFHQILDHS